jgi:integrase
MSLPRFYIERPTPGKPSLILLGFRYNNTGIRMSTKERCLPEHWDKNEQRVNDKWCTRFPDYLEVNRMLDEMASFTRRTYNQYRRERKLYELSPERFKSLVREFRDGTPPVDESEKDRVLIVDYYRQYLSDRDKENLKDATEAGDISTYRHFVAFAQNHPTPLYFDEFGLDTALAFRDYFWNADEPNSDNTTNKHLRRFLQVCKRAYISKVPMPINPGEIQLKEHLRLSKQPKETIALYVPELDRLAKVEFGNPNLAETRDLFLLGCFTGLRFNRWGEIKKDNVVDFDGRQTLELFTQKGTKKRVNIPLHPVVKEICERYKWNLPKVPSDVIINRNLKDIGVATGFTENVKQVVQRRGRSEILINPKYKLISTHTARRSFATNAFEASVPIEDISALVGHANVETTRHYIKLDQNAKNERIAALPFFNK